MSKGLAAIALLFVLLTPMKSLADTFIACWVETRVEALGNLREVTVCRLVGGETAEYPDETPPGPLEPAVGTDAIGQCWFLTSSDTDWQILASFSDGSAILGLYINGFLALDTGQIPRCTSEPDTGPPPEEVAWDAITEYIHDPPEPDLNPPIGRGLTGMETHLGVAVPGLWADTITIPLYSIDVEVWVEMLLVEWGDGTESSFPPAAYPQLIGYPDGLARHVYEVKTCDPPGREHDCDPNHRAYPLTVGYEWGARWRANGAAWVTVDVPVSTTTVDYPVTEAIASLTGVG